MSLRYEKGKLVHAATRGDGAVGEDVTANIRTLKDVPQTLKGKDIPDVAEIRGEVYMTKADFLALNERQKAAGKELYVNPRNTAAGSLRQKDASITASRPLRFFAYAWGQMSEMPADTQSGMVKWLGKAGFHTNPIFKVCKSAEELLDVARRDRARARPSSTTTSTASSTRSTGSTGRSGSASSRAARAGRSRTSSRPSRRRRWCATSRSRSAAPAR